MSTTGHENEVINVQGLKASLQKFKDDKVDKVITNAYYHEGAFYEESTHTTEITGEEGKIYIDIPTNREYRWDGAKYVLLKSEVDGSFVDESTFTYRPTAGALDVESRAVGEGGASIEAVKGNSVAWTQLLNPNDWVDMGLPSGTLWAKSNIDITQPNGFAASPFQYECSFFSWGNTDGHNPTINNSFGDWSWGSGNNTEPFVSSTGATLTSDITLPNDAANFVKGAIFRMPTTNEFQELFANIDYVQADGETVIDASQTNKLVTVNDVVGIYLRSKINGNLLFFPCSGFGFNASWSVHGSAGYYWSSSFGSVYGLYLLFAGGGVAPQGYRYRFYGLAVRPVVSKSALQEGKDGHKFASYDGNITDATLMYGSGSEPTTLDAFKSDLKNNLGYNGGSLPYNAGEVINTKMNAIESIGFNQYNNGKADVISGMEYQITGTYTSLSLGGETITPDANGKFTHTSDGELTVVGGGNDTCIHLAHSGDRDGVYEPYWKNTKAIDAIHIHGKANGEGELVHVFPDGMQGIGSAKDTISISNGAVVATKIIDKVNDLSSLNWHYQTSSGTERGSYTNALTNMYIAYNPTFLVTKYGTIKWYDFQTSNKRFFVHPDSAPVCFYYKDTSVTNGAELLEALSGVTLIYRLKAPVTYTDLVYIGSEYFADGTPVTLPVDYSVDDYGTEKITSEASMSLAPTLDIRYGINAKDTIRNLPYKYVSAVEPQNFTESQKQIARTNIGAVSMSDIANMFANLPTTDPEVAGALWNDGGTVKISAGAAQDEPQVEPEVEP